MHKKDPPLLFPLCSFIDTFLSLFLSLFVDANLLCICIGLEEKNNELHCQQQYH